MSQTYKSSRSDRRSRNSRSSTKRHKTIFVVLGLFVTPIVLLITLISAASPLKTQGQRADAKKEVAEDQVPVVNYDETQTTDQVEQSKRRIRGSKFDKSHWSVDPTDTSDTTVRVDVLDPNLPAFPFSQSTAVIAGEVTGARAYLSNDKTGVYTEFTVSIEEVIKIDAEGSLTVGSSVELIREGGRVKFPSGKVHLYKTAGEEMPRVGKRYVLFLTGSKQQQNLQILTGYEIQAGRILPLDKLPKSNIYTNANEKAFLDELRIKAVSVDRAPQ
jgi:hypothetical protein